VEERKFDLHYPSSGINKQEVKVGDVVIVHDDVPRMEWKLAVVERLRVGLNGYVRPAGRSCKLY